MFWFVMAGLVAVAVGIVVGRFVALDGGRGLEDVALGCLAGLATTAIAGLMLGGLAVPLCQATDGLWPEYSVGQRTGYLTKMSRVGVIWKTHEVELQVGVGQMASLQAPHKFSVVQGDGMLSAVNRYVGTAKRVTVHYKQWGLQPYRRGDSGYEIVGIEDAPE